MENQNGKAKFKSLYALIKCLLVLSHANSGPKCDFSINKHMICIYGRSIEEPTLESIYFVKDYLIKLSDFLNAPITKKLVKS